MKGIKFIMMYQYLKNKLINKSGVTADYANLQPPTPNPQPPTPNPQPPAPNPQPPAPLHIYNLIMPDIHQTSRYAIAHDNRIIVLTYFSFSSGCPVVENCIE